MAKKVCLDSRLGIVLPRLNNEQKGSLLALLLTDELPEQEDPIVWLCYEMGIEAGMIEVTERNEQ